MPVVCDLSSMQAVSDLTRRPELADIRFDVLINNVGLLMRHFETTAEGLETSYATNLLGHYILTEQLHDQGALKPGAAVISMVSGGLYNLGLSKSMLNIPQEKFNGFAAYAAHKRARTGPDRGLARKVRRHRRQDLRRPSGWADTAGVKHSLPKFRKCWPRS